MEEYFNIVQNWYKACESEINTDTRMFHLCHLFLQLVKTDFQKKDLPELSAHIRPLLIKDVVDEGMVILYEVVLTEEIYYTYRLTEKDMEEVKDVSMETDAVRDLPDMITHPSTEPEIDLKEIEFNETPDDTEFLKKLGI